MAICTQCGTTYTIPDYIPPVLLVDGEGEPILDAEGQLQYEEQVQPAFIEHVCARIPANDEKHVPVVMTTTGQNTINFRISGMPFLNKDQDFRLLGLFVKKIFDKGFLIRKEFYKTRINGVYSDLAVTDEYNYVTDPNTGQVTYRDEIISWILENGVAGEIKTIRKHYDVQNSIEELVHRRQNIVSDMKIYGMSLMVNNPNAAALQTAFVNLEATGAVRLYEQGIKQPLLDAIAAVDAALLTAEQKQILAGILG